MTLVLSLKVSKWAQNSINTVKKSKITG